VHTIYFGDNLDVLRRHAPDGSANLIYIDPPFNTGKAQSRTRIKTVRSDSGDRVGFQGQRYATAKMGSRAFPDRFDDYLAFLESRGVSYVFGGRASIDLRRVLAKLRTAFGIRRLLLEGGGKINGSFLAAGLIDELSILIAPVADGSIGTPTLFDARPGKGLARQLRLISIARIKGDLIWLRYKM